MLPAVVTIGSVPVHLYGLLLGVGIVGGGQVAVGMVRRCKTGGFELVIGERDIWDGLVFAMVGGVVGARFYHVVDLWDFYRTHLELVWQVWRGGLGVYGAILGGVVGLGGYSWWRNRTERGKAKEHMVQLLDVIAFGLPVAQAIGRLGNLVNQELYGLPTKLPWGIAIEETHRLPGYENFSRFHPLFGYEAILSLVSFGVLYGVFKRWRRPVGRGEYFGLYLGLYGLNRSLLEWLRIDPWMVAGVPVAVIIGLSLVIGSGVFLAVQWRRV